MPSAIVGALKVILTADTAEYNTRMAAAGKEAAKLSREFATVGRQMTQVGGLLTRAITLPLVAMGAGAVKAASDFESSFAGVRKTVEATEPEFAALAQGLRDMAKEIPVNVNELNKVAESAGQLGIKKDDILQFTRTMADLGVTTNLTADEAATATAQIQNIFGTAGKDVDRFGATLVALGNAGASTEKDIIAMGLRIAGAGNQVGLSQAQVLSFASALSSVGINAEAGGSAISRVFLKINDAVAKGGADLREFARVAGMTGPAFKQAFETDAATATVAFIEGLKRLKDSGENVNVTLEGLVGKNIIIKDTLMRASGAGKMLREQLELGDRAWKENSALVKEAAERYKTFESQLTVLWNQVKDVAITLGTSLLPILKDMIGLVTPMVGVIGQLAHWFAALPEPVRMTALGIAALLASVGPLLYVFGQLALAAGTIAKQFTAKGLVMRVLKADYAALALSARGLFISLGPIAAAITAIWAAWKIGNTETVKNSIAEWGLASENLTARLYRAIAGIEKMTPEQARAAVAATAAAEAAQKQAAALEQTGAALKSAGTAASEFVGPLEEANDTTSQFNENTKEAEKAAKAFAAALRGLNGQDAIAGAQEIIKQLAAIGGPLNVMPGKLEDMAAKLREGAQAALMMGKSDLASQYAKLADTLDPIIQFQQRYNVTIGEYVTLAPQAASWTEELVEQLHELGGTAIKIGPVLQSSMVLPWVRFKEAVDQAKPADLLAKSFGSIAEAFKNIGNTILAAVTGGGSVLKAVGSSIGLALGKDIAENMGANFKLLGSRLLGDVLGSMLPGLGALLGPALGKLFDGFKKLFGVGRNDEVKKYNAEINKLRKQLIDTHGNLETLEARANAVGLSFREAWGHQGQAGLAAFQELMREFEKRWGDNEEAVAKLNEELENTQGDLDDLIGKARDLGYEFDQAGKFTGVSFDKVKEKADEFGVSIDGLGPAFRQQRINAEAQTIIDGFELMARAGGDVGGILFGMKDEIGKLVGESIKMGTTIPANMKPWIEELIRTNQLTDENGNKITDITKIKFGEPVKTEFEKISGAIRDLIAKIEDLINKIGQIPTQKTITVTTEYEERGNPPSEENHGYEAPGYASGTMGRTGRWFGNFGTGMGATLHGLEAVVTPQQAPAFAMDVLSQLVGRGGNEQQAAPPPIVVQNHLNNNILIDGQPMKQWVLNTVVTAIDNNERGVRSSMRDVLGVTT